MAKKRLGLPSHRRRLDKPYLELQPGIFTD